MAFVHGKGSKTLINEYDLSAYFNNADLPREVDAVEVTTFGDSDREYIVGLRNSTMSLSGFWDASSSITPDEVLPADLGNATPILVTYAPNGLTVGRITYSIRAYQTAYNVTGPVDGPASITLDLQGSQEVSRGVSLANLSAITCDGSGTVVDQGAASSGAVAYLHVTDVNLSATGHFVVTVQDSPSSSGGAWADLITFADITSSTPSAERSSVTGNADKAVKAEWTIPSTGSATFAVAFAR